MVDAAELVSFYEDAYSRVPAEAAVYARWRALGARGKADHVIALCGEAARTPTSTLEVGCGDGALLSELRRRGFAVPTRADAGGVAPAGIGTSFVAVISR